MSDLATLVRTLCELPGPSGSEDAVREWLVERWSQWAANVTVTPLGNVVARIGGTGRRVALVAHMDEIAFFVTGVRTDGLLAADPLRPTPPERRRRDIPIGQPARILGDHGELEGTFVTVTGHVAGDVEEPDRRWWIDVGDDRDALDAAGVYVGTPIVSGAQVRRLGTRLVGKAMDDRAPLAAMTALIEREPRLRNELWLVATTQEEIGSVGASALGDAFTADVALALDVAPSGNLPGASERFALQLGAGPVLVHKDISMVYDRALGRELMAAAETSQQPLQHGAFGSYVSDGRELVRTGLRTGLLALPCRYTHSSYETVDLVDLEALIELLAAWLQT